MKRILLAVISVLLVAASVFGFLVSGWGITELSEINAEATQKTDELESSVKLSQRSKGVR